MFYFFDDSYHIFKLLIFVPILDTDFLDNKDCFHFFIHTTLHIWYITSTIFCLFVFLELRLYGCLLLFFIKEN